MRPPGDDEQASVEGGAVIDQSAGDPWGQAELALAAGDFREAVELLSAYLGDSTDEAAARPTLLPPQRLSARLMLGEAWLQLDRADEARGAVAPLLDDKGLSAEARARLRVFDARLLEHEGQAARALEEAEALWSALTAEADAGPEVLAEAVELVARLLAGADRFDDALDACDLAANLLTDRPDFEDDPMALAAAARALETMGRVSVGMASADAYAEDEASILERAAAALSVALRFYEGAFGPGHIAAVGAWEAVGDVMERMGHAEEATEARDTARDLLGG